MGDAAAFSFYPGKNLGTWGEGGAVTTDDSELARKIRLIRDHGSPQKYVHEIVGANFRINEFEAAVLGVKLPHLVSWNDQRNAVAKEYDVLLKEVSDVITIPRVAKDKRHVWHLYVVRSPKRDGLAAYLREQGIQTGIHYPTSLHLTPAYRHLGYKKGDFPNAEKAQSEILSLPMYPELPKENITYVADAIKKFYAR